LVDEIGNEVPENGSSDVCKVRDLTVEKRRFNPEKWVDEIVTLLVDDNTLTFGPKDEKKWPKTFFEVLVRSDWCKWFEAVKKEIDAWDDNNAVSIVSIKDIPHTAKIVRCIP
jgi:hypothetical protein